MIDLNFQRYGNAYVAMHTDAIYVVSFYGGKWVAYYRMSGMEQPAPIDSDRHGYGFGNPPDAMAACKMLTH